MAQQTWRSNLRRCLEEGNRPPVRIPSDGWYALCFGMPNGTPPPPHNQYALSMSLPDRSSVRLNLPLMHEGGVLEHHPSSRGSCPVSNTPLSNLNVGKLVFFTEGCLLSVSNDKKVSDEPRRGDDENSSSDGSPMWCVVQHRSSHPAGTNVGRLATFAKSLLCRYCDRTFPTLRGIQSHIHEIHEKQHSSLKRNHSGISADGSAATEVSMHSQAIYNDALRVVYQDAHMAIIIKPQGMPVMGCKPSLMRSDLLMAMVCTGSEKDQIRLSSDGTDSALGKPRPVHRLDSATGGLLVLAKTHAAESKLRVAFQERACHKRYRAVVVGKLLQTCQQLDNVSITVENDHGVIDSPISGKESKTLFQVVRHIPSVNHGGCLTVVDLWPITGRKHQLRKHMKLVGHHILGDVRHCGKSKAVLATETVHANNVCEQVESRLYLWAVEITLPHPVSGTDLTCRMDDPEWIEIIELQETALRTELEDRDRSGDIKPVA
jgi:23S rRNA-/tRNA-specific pseudouridylate synthase